MRRPRKTLHKRPSHRTQPTHPLARPRHRLPHRTPRQKTHRITNLGLVAPTGEDTPGFHPLPLGQHRPPPSPTHRGHHDHPHNCLKKGKTVTSYDWAPHEERFHTKYEKDPESGCWNWKKGIYARGYGRFRAYRKQHRAHRVSWEIHHGKPIPKSLVIDHLCENTRCVNPDHLEAVTQRENILRGNAPAAANVHKTHCPYGHPYDEENTYITTTGKRFCRTCGRRRTKAWHAKQKATASK